MHELSVCQGLIREVERVAAAHDACEVVALSVAIGPLSGVEPELLARAFEIARAGTIAERAMLQVETMPVVVECRVCGAESLVSAQALICGTCGSFEVDLKSGDELLLKRVEMTPAPAQAAAAAG